MTEQAIEGSEQCRTLLGQGEFKPFVPAARVGHFLQGEEPLLNQSCHSAPSCRVGHVQRQGDFPAGVPALNFTENRQEGQGVDSTVCAKAAKFEEFGVMVRHPVSSYEKGWQKAIGNPIVWKP